MTPLNKLFTVWIVIGLELGFKYAGFLKPLIEKLNTVQEGEQEGRKVIL